MYVCAYTSHLVRSVILFRKPSDMPLGVCIYSGYIWNIMWVYFVSDVNFNIQEGQLACPVGNIDA